MSRICEEFGCLPSEAQRELRRHSDLIGEIVELRGMQRAYQQFVTSKAEDSLPNEGADPMLDLVWEFTAEGLKRTQD